MKRCFPTLAFAISLGAALGYSATAQAQEPDLRNIRPHVMLLVDTSGSMERKPNCICATPQCQECLPVCSAPTPEQNRWAIVTQALTGEFLPFACASEARTGTTYEGQYDEGYFLDHVLLPHEIGSYNGVQDLNGILDLYKERIKFGLMTFDSIGTLSDQDALVTRATFEAGGNPSFQEESNGVKGMYSYGNNKEFRFPGATEDYMINNGARSAIYVEDGEDKLVPEGGLVSVGGDDSGDLEQTNDNIQATILGNALGKNPLRPFGPTPTDALVDDLEYFVNNDEFVVPKASAGDNGDAFYNCRGRSAILITDGFPNAVMRGGEVNCQDEPGTVGSTACPYDTAANTVASMISSGVLDKFYVIGFALDGDADEVDDVERLLNDIASVGDTDQAQFVADRADLVGAISTILNEVNPGATSRTTPVTTGLVPGLVQSEFITGFNASFDSSDPWDGILERRRTECDANNQPVTRTVEDSDRFHLLLNNQSAAPTGIQVFSGGTGATPNPTAGRNLWTILPTSDPDQAALLNSHLVSRVDTDLEDAGFDVPGDPVPDDVTRNVSPANFSNSIDPRYFGLADGDTAQRDTIVNYVFGGPGSGRENERLGDIYHSTPAIVGPLVDDRDDASFNAWRLGLAHQESPDPLEDLSGDGWQLSVRPRVIYAATNDGVIHAFLTDDYDTDAFTSGDDLDEFACANGKDAGTELWGFIAPMFLDNLKDLLSAGSKQWFADGNIVIRNLYDVREFGGDDEAIGQTNVWRTVLFMGLRNGGAGAIALDVTNPCKPEFLWQFTEADLSQTYGQPTAAQIFLQDETFLSRQSRGVVILPGGQGIEDATQSPCDFSASGPERPDGIDDVSGTGIAPRDDRRCWQQAGRSLYFIDLITGSIIREMDSTVFPAPLNGAVSVFRGDTGTVGSAAYLTDADGILWRINMSSFDPENWEAEALHDLYYNGAYDDAEPAYNPPVLTIDSQGNVVIVVATGNIDVLDDASAENRVVSITERLTFNPTGLVIDVEGTLNWEISTQSAAPDNFEPGEQVTGPLELFDGRIFFGSFDPGINPLDACQVDGSRIWSVSFLDDPDSPGNPEPRFTDSDDNPTTHLDSTDLSDLANNLVIGFQLAQLPICTATTQQSVIDPFLGATTIALPTATSGHQFRGIAHLSGSDSPSGGLSIDVVETNIGNPSSFTQVTGIADSVQ